MLPVNIPKQLMRSITAAVIILTLLHSCSMQTIEQVNLEQALNDSANTNKTFAVIATKDPQTILKLKSIKRYLAKHKNYTWALCDFSSSHYCFIEGICQITEFPAILIVKKANLIDILSPNNQDSFSSKKPKEDLTEACALIKTYLSLSSQDSNAELSSATMLSIPESAKNSFAYAYIDYKYHEKYNSLTNNQFQILFERYNYNSGSLFFPIYLDIKRRYNKVHNKSDPLDFPTRTIYLGELHKGEYKTFLIPVINMSDSSAMIYDIAVSCSCLDAKTRRMHIAANSKANIVIEYKAGTETGINEKNVIILSDNKSASMVNISANII